MGNSYSPRIATDGLVCCLDAGNSKPSGVQYVSDFSAGADGWGAGAGGVVGNIDGIAGQDNNLRFTCNTTASSSHYIHFNNGGNWSSVGDTIRITFDYYVPSGQSNIDGIGMYTYGPTVVQPYYSQMNTTNAWTSIDVTFDVSQSYGFVLYGVDNPATNYFHDSGGDDVFYIRNFTYTEVTSQRRMSKRDLSGSSNDITLVNGTVYSSGPPEAFTFDGTDDYATLSDSSDWNFGAEPFAIEQWLKFTDFSPAGDNWTCALQQYASESDRNGWMLFYSNTQEWRLECTAASPDFTPTHIVTGCSLNIWYLFTISREGSSFKMYINGVLRGTDTSNPTFDDIAGTMYVGNYAASDPHEFQGQMGALRIYKGKHLTDQQVKENFNAHRARYGL